jgi:monofunctional chorismate mutase
MKQTLLSLRKEIDKIDGRILDLMAKRIKIVHSVATYKKRNRLKVCDPKRESQILSKLKKRARKRKISPNLITLIFRNIMKDSRKIQKRDMK